MKLAPLAAALLALACSVPGCATDEAAPDPPVDPCLGDCSIGLGEAEAPRVDAVRVLASLKDFTEAFPYRQSGTPTHLASRDDLAARFEAAGLEVYRQGFPSVGTATAPTPQPRFEGENILGFKWGSDRERWIVVGAHYDISEGAVHGAYDDGSGTAMVLGLAAAFAAVETTRTLVFAQFDQEELGLVGSSAFINDVQAGTFPFPGEFDGMVDLDMIGITWPHPAHIVVWENSAVLTAKIIELANATDLPADHLDFRSSRSGSSDGAAFMGAGVATAYLWSDWDEYHLPGGTVLPSNDVPSVGAYLDSYPWWHKLDTYQTMVASAGGEDILRDGFQTTLDIVSPLLLYMAGPEFVPDAAEDS